MSKPLFVKKAEEDMDFEAEWVIKDLCEYAEKNSIECDFIFETFLKVFRKKIKAESEEEDGEAQKERVGKTSLQETKKETGGNEK